MISLLLTLAGYFKSRHQVCICFWSCPYGHKFGKETNSFFFNPRTYKGGRGIFKPSEVFLSFSLDNKTSAVDTFSRCLFIPRMHFETSLVMVNYYGYKL